MPRNLPQRIKGIKDHEPTVREVMALHRSKPLCASCHSRMDPLGLALENFKARKNVGEVAALDPYAVDCASGVESSPGIKDHDKIRSFVSNAKRAR